MYVRVTAATFPRAGRRGGRVLSEGRREREGGGEGDVGDGNIARCGRELQARAAHFDERGHGAR